MTTTSKKPGRISQFADIADALHVADAKAAKRSKAIEAGRAQTMAALQALTGVVEEKPSEASKAALDRATKDEVAHIAKMAAVTAEVEGAASALAKAHAQMSEDGCPNDCLVKPGQERRPPLAGKAALPRSAPGREMAVPTKATKAPQAKTPQTKAEQERRARELGLSLNGKAPAKAAEGTRAQYAWKDHEAAAARGTMPPKLNFSADTHTRFRPTLAKIEAAAEAGDVKALKAIEINPVSSSPKAMIRWRDMCVAALTAKPAKAAPARQAAPAKAAPAKAKPAKAKAPKAK